MRYKVLFTLLFSLFSGVASAQWQKINDLDYTWGPFKIYNIALFTETGEYHPEIRPLMLTLKYAKPVDGRDFAISIARAWANLGISLDDQDDVIDRLRKTLPDLKPNDSLSYIALGNRGYFVWNDRVIPEEFKAEVNDAILAIWLDPKVDLSQTLTTKKRQNVQDIHIAEYVTPEAEAHFGLIQLPSLDPTKEALKDEIARTEEAVDFEPLSAENLKKTTASTKPITPTPASAPEKKAGFSLIEMAKTLAEKSVKEVEEKIGIER